MTDAVLRWIKTKWCDWTHGGGHIERDSECRINWRCSRCGRWSDYPVPKAEERRVVDRELDEWRKTHD